MKPKKILFGLAVATAIILLLSGNGFTADRYVDDDGVCGGNTPCYTTIQAAITAAGSHDNVWVYDGTYNETITMKDLVNVENAAGQTPYIEAKPGNFDRGVVEFKGSITCKLTGFTIKATDFGSAIFVDGSVGQVTTIDNCTAHCANFGTGIRLKGTVSVTIMGCDIYNDSGGRMRLGIGTSGYSKDRITSDSGNDSSITIKDTTIGGSGQGLQTCGIRLRGDPDRTSVIRVTIGDSTINPRNTISYNGYAGILLADIDEVSIENYEIFNNGRAGILLVDASTVSPHIKNNTIHDHVNEAGINIGGASNVTIGDGNQIYGNLAGIAFYVASNPNTFGTLDPITTKTASSQPVAITGNDINHNTKAGIAVIDNVTGTITINNNKILQNTKAGIAFFNGCTAVITDNEIYTHAGAAGIFTGDWSGTLPKAGTGFYRTNGPANLTIKRNKVYGNRSGMRLDHASGTINNNLVYGNSRAGIRFSGNNVSPYAPFSSSWGITEIKNNTVADNGSYVDDPGQGISEDRGGGIVYDDISDTATRDFFDPPVGATQNPITIKNNIVANNEKAGIKFCADNTGDNRSYNLFYQNQKDYCATGGSVDCGRMCRGKSLGRCDAQDVNCCSEGSWADFDAFPGAWATGEICGQDPLFNADYTLQWGSPAIGMGSDNHDMGAYGGTDPITW